MRYKQQKHYFLYGLRAHTRLLKPRMIPMGKLHLPLETIYQYMHDNTAVVGPSPQDRLFNTEGGRLFIEHVKALDSQIGNPRRTVISPVTIENDYRRMNRVFKPVRKDEAVTIMNKNMLVINYNMLNPLYRYTASYKATYYRWYNNAVTFWNHVLDIHQRFNWNQYLDFELPPTVPSRGKWDLITKSINQTSLGAFPTPSHLNAVEVYKWLGEDRESSLLAKLPSEALAKINFIFRARTHWFTLNLGELDRWRKDPTVKDSAGLAPREMQVRLIKLLQGLSEFSKDGMDLSEDEDGLYINLEDTPTVEKTTIRQTAVVDDTPVDTGVDEDDDAPAPIVVNEEDEPLDLLPGLDMGPVSIPQVPIDRELDFESLFDEPDLDDDGNTGALKGPTLDELSETTASPGWSANDEPDEPSTFADTLLSDPNVADIAMKAFEMAETGIITHRAMNRAIEEALSYHTLPDPYSSGQSIAEAMVISSEDLQLPPNKQFPDVNTVPDKSMLSSKLKDINKKYVTQVLRKDVLQAVVAIQKQGVAVKDYKVDVVRDVMNHYEIHAVTLKPIRGRQTTVRFRLPVVDKDGRFMSNGVVYRMKLQRADVPIRKVADNRVALTSYYNKTFVERSKRKVDDYERWLLAQLKLAGMDNTDTTVTDLRLGDCFASEEQLPRIYTLVSKAITEFKSGDYHLYFDYAKREAHFHKQGFTVSTEETGGQVMVGTCGKQAVCVDQNNVFYLNTPDGQEPLGTLTELLQLDTSKAPIEVAEMTVQNKVVPVGFVLAYYFGFSTLLKELGAEHSRHPRGERLNLTADEYTITFRDEVVVLSKLDPQATLIFNGMNRYHRSLKKYSIWDFDKKDVYYRLLEEGNMGVRYLRELDTLKTAWMDPITEGLLRDMGEPTQFDKLLLRAIELLLIDYSPKEVDPAFMRYRGYERFAGTVYGELSRAVKTFNNRAAVGETGVELNPYAVWQRLVQDGSVGIVEDSNPIANLREQEGFTYRGDGGRSSVSMVERHRIYHPNDTGTVSESTVDAGDVGIIAYLAPDANITNLRGFTERATGEVGPSKLISSSALLSPCAEHDDAKRIGFISIQHQQGIFADGYDVTPLRSGYEQIVAQRTTAIFASAAEQSGTVIAVNKNAIHVQYQDGSEERFPLGLHHGTASGHTYPHVLVTDLKAGDTFKEGTTLSYNEKFFTPDRYNPGQVSWKAGVLCNVAFIEKITTLEDGCEISEETAKKFNTQSTEIRNIVVDFTQNVHSLVKVGDHVDLDSILCTIEDPELADNPLFDDVALDTLRRVEAKSPRANVVGVVSRIECFYHGDFEDMSENLQAIAKRSDKERRAQATAMGQPPLTGEVDFSFRIKGEPIDPDSVAIRVYIDHDVSASIGDKGVMASQMKTIISGIFSGDNTLETGEPLHLKFANTSVEERIVLSPKLIATTNMLLAALSKHVAAVYRGNANAKSTRKS